MNQYLSDLRDHLLDVSYALKNMFQFHYLLLAAVTVLLLGGVAVMITAIVLTILNFWLIFTTPAAVLLGWLMIWSGIWLMDHHEW